MWDADPGSLLLVLQILASDAAGVDKLLATLGSGDAFKTKLNAELVKGGLKESTGVTAPAKGEALLMAATATNRPSTRYLMKRFTISEVGSIRVSILPLKIFVAVNYAV